MSRLAALLLGLLVSSCATAARVPELGSAPKPSGARAHEIALHGIAPTIEVRHAEAVWPVMVRAAAELARAVDVVAETHPEISLAMSGAHGSWFLPLVEVGSDLDYLGVFDVGELPSVGAGDAAITRVEAVLRALRERPPAVAAETEMALLDVEGIDEGGWMHRRAEAVALVERASAAVGAAGIDVSYGVGERSVPYHFPPGVVSLPIHPRASYLSDRFALDPAIAAHVREVSIELLFVAHTPEGATLLLQPFYARGATPIEAWTFIYGVVFTDPEARDRFVRFVIPPDFDLTERSVMHGSEMLEVARREVDGPRPIKAAKRLLQSLLMIEAGFPEDAAALRAELRDWLTGPGAGLADLAAVAEALEQAAEVGVEQAFRTNGKLEQVVRGYQSRLRREASAAGDELDSLLALLDATLAAEPAERQRAWADVRAEAVRAARILGPDRERLRHWVDRLTGHYAAVGCRWLPVHGVHAGTVRLLATAGDGLGSARDRVRWPGPGWRLEWTAASADDAPPARMLYVRLATSPVEHRAWAELRRALEAVSERYVLSAAELGRKR